jgi:hypothetical protein
VGGCVWKVNKRRKRPIFGVDSFCAQAARGGWSLPARGCGGVYKERVSQFIYGEFESSRLWRSVSAMLLHNSRIVGDQFDNEGSTQAAEVLHPRRR